MMKFAKTCNCKPAAHHVELIEDIPNILTFSINHVKFADTLQRIYTPILCDTTINLRGMTAQNFDEADLKCTLLAAILHKGPFEVDILLHTFLIRRALQ
jgi:hypothetical protein